MPDSIRTVIDLAQSRGFITREQARQLMAEVEKPEPAADLPPGVSGERFGKFVLVAKIGEGGMGTVWKAWQIDLGRWVALKFLKSDDPEDLARFVREAQTTAKVSHPGVIPIHDAGVADGRHFIAMEFVEGDTLQKIRVGPRRAAELMRDVARAVDAAHAKGIIHRDLKPQNVMITKDGRVVVMDFGLAKSMQAPGGLSVSGTIIGTPNYMAPEQALGELRALDARTDVYGLAATLYDMVTGRPPFDDPSIMELLRKVAYDDPPPPRRFAPALDADLQTIILKGLEKDPAKRYAGAAEFADDLERHLRGEPILARPVSMVTKAVKRVKRNPVPYALATVIVAGLLTWSGGLVGARIVREARKNEAVRQADEAFQLKDWDSAAAACERGLQTAPGDPDLEVRSRRASAGQAFRQAVRYHDEWHVRLKEVPKLEARRADLAETMSDVPPSGKGKLWDVEERLHEAGEAAELDRERAVQWALSALEFDKEFLPARKLAAEIRMAQLEEAEMGRDPHRAAILREAVAAYGDAEDLAKLGAPGSIAMSIKPADAKIFLFRYEARGKRLIPLPCDAAGKTREVELSSVDPVAIDAADDAKRRSREGGLSLAAAEYNRATLPLKLPAGSYLLLIRRDGFADARFPILLRRGDKFEASVELDRPEDVPEGFVRICAGRFVAGGDPLAADLTIEPRKSPEPSIAEFYVRKFPVTAAEYLEYLNDRHHHSAADASKKSPRRTAGGDFLWSLEGDRVVMSPDFKPDWPIFGISWDDAQDFLGWLNRRGRGRGWAYDRPTEDEWEKAARGVDGRLYPWGDAFDSGFASTLLSHAGAGSVRPSEPVGLYPADESPYGVRDMAGVVRTWTRTEGGVQNWYVVKGGSFGLGQAWSRAAQRSECPREDVNYSVGLRLIARRLPQGK